MVKRAWQGGGSQRLRGLRRVKWPTEGGWVVDCPSGVLVSLIARLGRHYGLSAPDAVGLVRLWAQFDATLAAATDSSANETELCGTVA